MKNKLSDNYNFFKLIKFSISSIIAMVFMSLYTMVDGIFVSILVETDVLATVNVVFKYCSWNIYNEIFSFYYHGNNITPYGI